MTGRERNHRGSHPDVLGAALLQHRMSSPACIEITSASPKRFEDRGLQPVPRIGRRIAAPRRGVWLLNRNDPARLRQPPELVHQLRVSTHWREEEANVSKVK